MTEKKRQAEAKTTELTDDELAQAHGAGVIFLPIGDKKSGRKNQPNSSASTKLVGTATVNPDGN